MRTLGRLLALLAIALLLGLAPPVAAGGNMGSPNAEMVWVSPGLGPVGTVVNIKGSGWRRHAGAVASLTMCTPTSPKVATAKIAKDGTFAFPPVTIPAAPLYAAYGADHCVFTVTGDGVTIAQWWLVTI
jgi:hypothetical protein